MGCLGYFVTRPQAEIDADFEAAKRKEIGPNQRLTAEEASRIIQRQHEARRAAGKQMYTLSSANLDPVLRHHLKLDPAK